MQVLPIFQWAGLGFFISLLFAVSFCHGNNQEVMVVGTGECADCDHSNIKTSQAFSGSQSSFYYLLNWASLTV